MSETLPWDAVLFGKLLICPQWISIKLFGKRVMTQVCRLSSTSSTTSTEWAVRHSARQWLTTSSHVSVQVLTQNRCMPKESTDTIPLQLLTLCAARLILSKKTRVLFFSIRLHIVWQVTHRPMRTATEQKKRKTHGRSMMYL